MNAADLSREIYEGDLLKSQLQHLATERGEKTKGPVREDIRAMEAHLSFLRREFQQYVLKSMAEMTGTALPEFDGALTKNTREAIRQIAQAHEFNAEAVA